MTRVRKIVHVLAKGSTSQDTQVTETSHDSKDPEATKSESGSTPPATSPVAQSSPVEQSQPPQAPPRFDNTGQISHSVGIRCVLQAIIARNVVIEKGLVLSDFVESYPRVNEVFTKQGWEKMLSSLVRVSHPTARSSPPWRPERRRSILAMPSRLFQ